MVPEEKVSGVFPSAVKRTGLDATGVASAHNSFASACSMAYNQEVQCCYTCLEKARTRTIRLARTNNYHTRF